MTCCLSYKMKLGKELKQITPSKLMKVYRSVSLELDVRSINIYKNSVPPRWFYNQLKYFFNLILTFIYQAIIFFVRKMFSRDFLLNSFILVATTNRTEVNGVHLNLIPKNSRSTWFVVTLRILSKVYETCYVVDKIIFLLHSFVISQYDQGFYNISIISLGNSYDT